MDYSLRSMTGFARVQAPTDAGALRLEIKSVNHRYLEVLLRQPEELRGTDSAVRARLNAAFGRGKLEVTMRLSPSDSGEVPELVLNTEVLDQVASACRALSARVPELAPADPLALLRWPGVLQDPAVDEEQVAAQVLEALDRAIAELDASRAGEGARLGAVIEDRLQQIEAQAAAVAEHLPEQNRRWREKLIERLKEVADLEPERRDQALVQFAQRADVDEELERLQMHVAEVRAALCRKGPIGRKLDFYMQELNREANTLGSKSMDADITRCAVELKVLIEQMREQVQNIE